MNQLFRVSNYIGLALFSLPLFLIVAVWPDIRLAEIEDRILAFFWGITCFVSLMVTAWNAWYAGQPVLRSGLIANGSLAVFWIGMTFLAAVSSMPSDAIFTAIPAGLFALNVILTVQWRRDARLSLTPEPSREA